MIIVTNRKLCKDNFLKRVEFLAKGKPKAIMLREKDLSLKEYMTLANEVNTISIRSGIPLVVNKYIDVAKELNINNLHLSMDDLRFYKNNLDKFNLSCSVHNLDEATEAEGCGAIFLVAGHIFDTDCKKGIPGRGLSYLKEICQGVSIPVYAIGGITIDNYKDVIASGAKGCCIMSQAMVSKDPQYFVENFNLHNL